ncbi:uncharacterized protein LOC119831791 [Zerene cesonia]|uniref:uncharacterized protein LOC119831791 n=1 Tax=Zerene cesonia TaxID=33412 RepID=UPI0018E56346|nr:uncharacterized protein LOC119831791 [Zerene cesonia]
MKHNTEFKSGVCEGKTVKEIANHFEKIAQYRSDIEERLAAPPSRSRNASVRQSITEPNISFPPRNSPFVFARKPNYLRCDINLHAVWKHAVLHGNSLYFKRSSVQSRKGARNAFGVRESLRSSFVACVLLLQYVM